MAAEEQPEGVAEVAFREEDIGSTSQGAVAPRSSPTTTSVFLVSMDLYIFWKAKHIAPSTTPFYSSVPPP